MPIEKEKPNKKPLVCNGTLNCTEKNDTDLCNRCKNELNVNYCIRHNSAYDKYIKWVEKIKDLITSCKNKVNDEINDAYHCDIGRHDHIAEKVHKMAEPIAYAEKQIGTLLGWEKNNSTDMHHLSDNEIERIKRMEDENRDKVLLCNQRKDCVHFSENINPDFCRRCKLELGINYCIRVNQRIRAHHCLINGMIKDAGAKYDWVKKNVDLLCNMPGHIHSNAYLAQLALKQYHSLLIDVLNEIEERAVVEKPLTQTDIDLLKYKHENGDGPRMFMKSDGWQSADCTKEEVEHAVVMEKNRETNGKSRNLPSAKNCGCPEEIK